MYSTLKNATKWKYRKQGNKKKKRGKKSKIKNSKSQTAEEEDQTQNSKSEDISTEQAGTDDESKEKTGSENSPSSNSNKKKKRKEKEMANTPPRQTKKTKMSQEKTLMENADIVKSFLDDLEPDDYPKIQHVKAAYLYIYHTISPRKTEKNQQKTKATTTTIQPVTK